MFDVDRCIECGIELVDSDLADNDEGLCEDCAWEALEEGDDFV